MSSSTRAVSKQRDSIGFHGLVHVKHNVNVAERSANRRQLIVTLVAQASMEFSTNSAMAFSGFDCDRAMIVIAFQSLPMRSLPR